jgi:hypothetical protein
MKFIGWFSAGASSAAAIKIALDEGLDVDIYYVDTGAVSPDNSRFIEDCKKWYGREIIVLKNRKYDNPLDVARRRKIFNTPNGSPCTMFLKREVYKQVQKQYDEYINIIGYDYSSHEIDRAVRYKLELGGAYFPLIEHRINKPMAMKMLADAGIELPEFYKNGYRNNNCIGCFKGGCGYWNKIRRDYPKVFSETAKLEREIGASVLKDKGRPLYLDELPNTKGRYKPIEPCDGLFCLTALGVSAKIKDKEQFVKLENHA